MCWIKGNQGRGCVSREENPLSCANEKDASIQRAMCGGNPSIQLSHKLYLDGWSRHHDTKNCLQTIAWQPILLGLLRCHINCFDIIFLGRNSGYR